VFHRIVIAAIRLLMRVCEDRTMNRLPGAPGSRSSILVLSAFAACLPLQPAFGQQTVPPGGVVARSVTSGAGGVGPDVRTSRISRAETKAIKALQAAIVKKDYVAAGDVLTKAKKVAKFQEAKHLVATLQLQLGLATENLAVQSEAVRALLTSGMTPKESLPALRQMEAAISENMKAPASGN
jgi:hypothetical protein